MMDNYKERLDDIAEDMSKWMSRTFERAERQMVEVARDWTRDHHNHYVYIEEGMGKLFVDVYRVGRDEPFLNVEDAYDEARRRRLWYKQHGEVPAESALEDILQPLEDLRVALSNISDVYHQGVGFYCFYRGKSVTRARFLKLREKSKMKGIR